MLANVDAEVDPPRDFCTSAAFDRFVDGTALGRVEEAVDRADIDEETAAAFSRVDDDDAGLDRARTEDEETAADFGRENDEDEETVADLSRVDEEDE